MGGVETRHITTPPSHHRTTTSADSYPFSGGKQHHCSSALLLHSLTHTPLCFLTFTCVSSVACRLYSFYQCYHSFHSICFVSRIFISFMTSFSLSFNRACHLFIFISSVTFHYLLPLSPPSSYFYHLFLYVLFFLACVRIFHLLLNFSFVFLFFT